MNFPRKMIIGSDYALVFERPPKAFINTVFTMGWVYIDELEPLENVWMFVYIGVDVCRGE